MKKDLMYYVHQNRKKTWDKITREASRTGKPIWQIAREISRKMQEEDKALRR